MAFSDIFLEELTARTDITSLVSRYVALKKQGGSYVGLCPFHSEKTPSFTVSPDKQLFYCFGCGTGGGVMQFLMRMENLTFADAVHQLAEQAGLAVPEENDDSVRRAQRETLLRLNREAARHFFVQLMETAAGDSARAYLTSRGLSPGTVKRFGLGYAPDNWDNLMKAMLSAGFTKGDLLSAGLVVSNKTGGLYDRFRGRLIFPIIDLRGHVIAFGGRVLDNSLPKYLNSPETPVFSKSRHLFGLNIAKNSKQGRLILAEGYMDVLSLHQAGFDCAVASLGTSLTPQQALLMSRHTKEVVISYDMDTAGQKAAARAIGILEQAGVSVRVLRLNSAKDPDEYINQFGREAFAALLTAAETQMEYRLAVLASRYQMDVDEQRLQFCREVAQLLATLTSEAERDIYTVRAAAMCKVSPDALKQDVKRVRAQLGRREKQDTARKAARPVADLQPADRALHYSNARSASAEEGIIQMIFTDASLASCAAGLLTEEDFSSPFLGRLFAYAMSHADDPSRVFTSEQFTSEELSHVTRLLHKPRSFASNHQAVDDCADIVLEECRLRRAAESDTDPLLLYAQAKKEKKGYGG